MCGEDFENWECPEFEEVKKSLERVGKIREKLKKYIGDSFGINAPEMTSAEFVRFIGRLDLGMDIRKRINEFVKSADPFKYAGKVPEKNRAKEDLVCVREIISDIEAQVVRQEEQQ